MPEPDLSGLIEWGVRLIFATCENGVPERLQIDGLRQVLFKARLAAAAEVIILTEAADGDAADLMLPRRHVPHHVMPGAVGETEVAQQQVKALAISKIGGLSHAGGRRYLA